MDIFDEWDIGTFAENYVEVKDRPKVRGLLKKWVWYKFRFDRLDLRPMDLFEIQEFFEKHPWLSIEFRISSITPLDHVLAYFSDIAGVRTMTTDLEQAQRITNRPIAHGGLVDIYQATLADGSQVAVKCLRQRPTSDNKGLKHTARELDTWAKLDHLYILKLFGLAELHGNLSMVSPWMDYGNVVSVVNKWPELHRYLLCAQLADVVAHLHSPTVDVIHGDIKGDNVLVDQNGRIKLTDFGLAITHDQMMRFSETDPGGGTARWMAPELFSEDGKRCRETDVYAMGMTMMEIMTGRIPFSEIQFGPAVIKAVSMDRRIPKVPELQEEPITARAALMHCIMLRCWRHEPDKRATANVVQSMMEFLGLP